MQVLNAYINFMTRNPVFSVYAIGVKVIVGWTIYDHIKELNRSTGEALAK